MLKIAKIFFMLLILGNLNSFVLPVFSEEVDEIQKAIEDQKKAFEQLKMKLEGAKERKKKIAKIEQNLERMNALLVTAEKELADAEKIVESNKTEMTEIGSNLDKSKQQQSPIREALAEMIDERTKLRKLLDEKQKQLDDLDSRIASEKQKLTSMQETRINSEKRVQILQTEMAKNKENVKRAEMNVIAIEKDMNQQKNELKALKK